MILEQFKLLGKVAIVTGPRRGLGLGIAEGLAEAGADIVGVGPNTMFETREKIEKLGRNFLEINIDLSDENVHSKILENTLERFGKVDILVNNAGIIRRENFEDFNLRDWDDVMRLNIRSVFLLSQAVVKQFIKQGNGGKIINIASLLSFQGGIRTAPYTASKSAIAGLTKLMANELAKYRINVNAIAPGYMATDNTKDLREDEVRSKEILSRIPFGRWGTPKDLKGAAVFLASAASDYVNGHILVVDGGWLSR